ncbi:hypothetical protein [Methanolobus halotolerans]|uniref:DUF5667 domain-containing protein n=1 Tax=Methanolobus halotolerans TaxID=2052935 RepID=A0A4E0Q442_9EURY|nr:hypothetical protein [Methanolobus halotolerans]TGC08491.1 hypothetical protein CUN85_09235 [Methanolobus halotolerans]
MNVAEGRLNKAGEAADEGNAEEVIEASEEYAKYAQFGEEIAAIAQMIGKDSSKVNELVAKATSLHLIALQDLNQTAPEQARISIQKAIEQTEMARESTIVALEKTGLSVPDISNGTNISSDFGSNSTNVSSDVDKVEENRSETEIEIPAGKP